MNDNITYLIDMFRAFYEVEYESILCHIESRITEFNLSKTNDEGYKLIRAFYNQNKKH